jgi:DNA modification methylase
MVKLAIQNADNTGMTQPLITTVPELLSHSLRRHSGFASPTNGNANKLDPLDRAAHDWYRFVLSYPPHLVRRYLDEFGLKSTDTVLDPFCGTGTTLVEAKKLGICAVGLEVNPFAHFASTVKLDWRVNAAEFKSFAGDIAEKALRKLRRQGIHDDAFFMRNSENLELRGLDEAVKKLILTNSISPLPLHKTLLLLDTLREAEQEPFYCHARLALANALVYKISNLHFGPEVGVGKPKPDVPVIAAWLSEIHKMTTDLSLLQGAARARTEVFNADARRIGEYVKPGTIAGVITSPPYPNEKDYTRTTRLESVLLGFIRSKDELRTLKKGFVRSNTRGVYKEDDDDRWVADHPEINRIANAIEDRRIELGKTSGFERMYARVAKLYFGGMARHLSELRPLLKPGAQLAYVVGDQASYLRVMIRTGELLADIAQGLGYRLQRIDLFRTRLATASREQLREEVVVLEWPGKKR